MSIKIGTNIGSLQAIRQLEKVTASQGEAYERLSSGLRINRASDDAAGLAIVSRLNSDSRVYGQALRNIGDATSYISIADGATNALTDIVTRGRELAEQAANGSLSASQRSSLDNELQALVAEHNRILDSTKFNGIQIFGAEGQEVVFQTGYDTRTVQLSTQVVRTVGDGSFTSQDSDSFGGGSESVAVGDFNGDGIIDALSSAANTTLYLSTGNSPSSFNSGVVVDGGAYAAFLAVGDVNEDGKLDFAAQHGPTVLYLGNGNGTFLAETSFAGYGIDFTGGVGLRDLNSDGHLDLVTAGEGPAAFRVRLGAGTGGFGAATDFNLNGYPDGLEIADVNNDGKLDLLTTSYSNNGVFTALGNGDGTFGGAILSVIGGSNSGNDLEVADFNGDGKKDVAFSGNNGSVNILFGTGTGNFNNSSSFNVGVGTDTIGKQIDSTDINKDGRPDLVIASEANVIFTYFNQGDGTFALKTSTSAFGGAISLVDLNGDGVDDIVGSRNGVQILFANVSQSSVTERIERLAGISIRTRTEALSTLDSLGQHQNNISLIRGKLGASESRLKSVYSTLQSARENSLLSASRIADVDVADVSAQLVRTNILQQVSASVLAQANQQPRLALSLIAG